MNLFYKFSLDREPTEQWSLVIKHSASETLLGLFVTK